MASVQDELRTARLTALQNQIVPHYIVNSLDAIRMKLILDGQTLYLTHGHHHNPNNLPPLPEGSIFLSGHTHVKMDEVTDGIRCLNPGSVSIPKDGSNSCLIYENKEFIFRILEE